MNRVRLNHATRLASIQTGLERVEQILRNFLQ
jgi:hypothetical protein